jgi:AcrR family transcriptional regulator
MSHKAMDTARVRREQIIEAAAAIISEHGLPNLSLSAIEKKAGMSRGQLTYYFPTKEDILLAVFDRVLFLMYERMGRPEDEPGVEGRWWDWVQHLMTKVVVEPPVSPEFGGLQYTFLAQSTHREDFRRRLAQLYEEWRSHMSQGLADHLADEQPVRQVSPRAMATVVQALLHGLGVQLAADSNAFDRQEAVELCLNMLSTYVWGQPRAAGRESLAARNGKRPHTNKRAHRPTVSRNGRHSVKGSNHVQ